LVVSVVFVVAFAGSGCDFFRPRKRLHLVLGALQLMAAAALVSRYVYLVWLERKSL
jgi:hypothetical protein